MKSQPNPHHDQLNLPLLNLSPTALPAGRDKELTLALVELLVRAASSGNVAGGGHESEADC
jgi:hypothetical protein